jgi:hypothetical protein
LLEAQREHTDALQREKGIICPWVFHREGVQIRVFKRKTKCAVGLEPQGFQAYVGCDVL